ncbi:MAG: hypothetical protein II997_09575 [Clostridia bacterium]|nr:hypothetical protein [Clostridia bacterium]
MTKHTIKAEVALKDICARYRVIKKSEIEAFGPVYYPIARIEADMHEKTFEDFDAVQESVLRFISIGFKEEAMIANLMGLTTNYVQNMMKMLLSYGHIDPQRNITPLGMESLAQGQKIMLIFTKQVFLLDALNCNIIRIDKDLDRTIVEHPDEMTNSEKHITFLDHAAGISKEDVEKTLKESQFSTLQRLSGGMNINVTAVSDVRCLGIRYVKSYLLKLKGHPPVIFVKRFDYNGKGAERFYWLPFSVEEQSEGTFFGLPDMQVHNYSTSAMIHDAYNRMLENGASEWVQEEMQRSLEELTKKVYGIELMPDATENTVHSSGFSKYATSVLRLLYGFGKDGLFSLVDDRISGNIMILYPDKTDTKLMQCAEYVCQALDQFAFDKVHKFMEKRMQKNDSIIEDMTKILKELLSV